MGGVKALLLGVSEQIEDPTTLARFQTVDRERGAYIVGVDDLQPSSAPRALSKPMVQQLRAAPVLDLRLSWDRGGPVCSLVRIDSTRAGVHETNETKMASR